MTKDRFSAIDEIMNGKQESVEIVCIIDKSGSMDTIKADAMGGFNAFLESQQKLPGDARITVTLFDTSVNMICDATPLSGAAKLTPENYIPGGYTSLFDAIGKTVTIVSDRHKKAEGSGEKPDKIIVCILTDGEENSSKQYKKDQILSLINTMRDEHKWEFVYVGVGPDAFKADAIGIPQSHTMSVPHTGYGTQTAYGGLINYYSSSRSGQPTENWNTPHSAPYTGHTIINQHTPDSYLNYPIPSQTPQKKNRKKTGYYRSTTGNIGESRTFTYR